MILNLLPAIRPTDPAAVCFPTLTPPLIKDKIPKTKSTTPIMVTPVSKLKQQHFSTRTSLIFTGLFYSKNHVENVELKSMQISCSKIKLQF